MKTAHITSHDPTLAYRLGVSEREVHEVSMVEFSPGEKPRRLRRRVVKVWHPGRFSDAVVTINRN